MTTNSSTEFGEDDREKIRRELEAAARELEGIAHERTLSPDGLVHPFYEFRPLSKQGPPYRMDAPDFLSSEAKFQVVVGGNRSSKTWTALFKLICYAVGFNPVSPLWQAPAVTNRPFVIWTCCPAKKTREALAHLARFSPPSVAHQVFYAKGEERIEYAPTPRRPFGTVIRVMSYGLPIDQFQGTAVDILHFDEEPEEDIWTECEMRLVSTDGIMILTFTSKTGLVWLHKKLRNIDTFRADDDPHYCAQTGDFAWFMQNQRANPVNKPEAIERLTKNLTEQEKLIRIDGHFIPLAGSRYFDGPSLTFIRNKDVRQPSHALYFDVNRKPQVELYRGDLPFAWEMWEIPQPGATYAIGADIGRGKGELSDVADYSAAFVLCVQSNEVVARFHSNQIDPMDFALDLANASQFFNNAIVGPETNIEESAVLYVLRDLRVKLYQREQFSGRHKRFEAADGWYTTQKSKTIAMKNLYLALRNRKDGKPGSLFLHDEETVEELFNFGYLSEKRQGAYGLGALDEHDDLVLALAITLMVAKQAPQGTLRNSGAVRFQTAWQQIVKELEDDEKKRYKNARFGRHLRAV